MNDARLDPALKIAIVAAGLDADMLPRVYMYVNPNEVKVRAAACCCEGANAWSECSVCGVVVYIYCHSPYRSTPQSLASTEGTPALPQLNSISSRDYSLEESPQHSQVPLQRETEQPEAPPQPLLMQTGHTVPHWVEYPEIFPTLSVAGGA